MDDVSTVERMVRAIDDTWTVRDVSEIRRGGNETFRVVVETRAGPRECILKTSAGGGGNLGAEARLTRLLAAESTAPVPAVYGIVDEHPALPAPFFLMERVAGESLAEDSLSIPVETTAAVARDTGRYLGDVHGLDAFDGFGPIAAVRNVEADSSGGAGPLAREYGLAIPDPYESWAARLDATVESMLDRHRETRFADLTDRLAATIADRYARLDLSGSPAIARLDLSGSPAIARLDHGPQNYVVDADDRVTALLDWGIAKTTHREYDLACAEQGLCATAGLESDRRQRVRAALYDGYRETSDLPTGGEFGARRRLYLLVFALVSMNWVSDWVTPDVADELERDVRRAVEELL